MFFPVSKPTQVFEPQPMTIVGLQSSSNPHRPAYRVRSLSTEEADIHCSYSDLVTNLINSRGDVKELSNNVPLIGQDFKETAENNQNQRGRELSSNKGFTASIRQEIESLLALSPSNAQNVQQKNGEKNFKFREHGKNEFHDTDIHAFAKNHDDVLNIQAINDDFHDIEDDVRLFSANDMLTPAETALRGDVVDISKVFDPSNQNDVELFGLEKDDDYNDDSDDVDDEEKQELHENREKYASSAWTTNTYAEAMMKKLEIKSDDTEQSQLDDELDTLIGESFGATDISELKKKKARLARQKVRNDDTVWATDDVIDVSDFAQLVPEPAIEYPFNLDTFQKRAVYRLERDENVFVAAHTSAGKTVVAEYAIALAMHRKTKVIYTSPIKTLSNQKFRDFTERFTTLGFGEGDDRHFGNVGIITGDISINPEADCLIMTTEILRSMLYKGADVIRDLSHVIFDECHWLNNPERGVVWEEAIIMLPRSVTIVMLSATVPNAMEFAKWVGTTKEKPVFVVHTPKRPVPLSHQLFVKGEVFKLFDSSQNRFLDANYRRAAAHYKENTKNSVRQGVGRHHSWMQMVKYLRKQSLDPAILFCFSKKKCDEAAEQLGAQDLTSGASDKSHIHQFYQNAISRLSIDDRNVPQITRHREMLKRGIGVHHAGLLPIIKEITEVLFQSGYVRILFATETFAMGVNMPARTVVFTAIHKFDSQSFRLLEPGEYVQMAGRAGRRGLDDVGTVLLYPSTADFPVESDVKSVLVGTPKPLRSQFRLTYNMILNLLRIEELRVEDVMARSFSEAPAQRNSKGLKQALEKGSKKLNVLQQQGTGLQTFRDLYDMSMIVERLSKDIAHDIIQRGGNSASNTLAPGRVILIRRADRTLRIAVIIKGLPGSSSRTGLRPMRRLGVSSSIASAESKSDAVKAVTLLGGAALIGVKTPLCAAGIATVETGKINKQFNCNGIIVEVETISLENVDIVSSLKIPVNERDLNPIRGIPNLASLNNVAESLRQICTDESNWSNFPSVHALGALGLDGLDVATAWEQRVKGVSSIINTLSILVDTGAAREMLSNFDRLTKASRLEAKLGKLRAATSDETLQLMPDYRQRAMVLQRLGYIDGTTVRLKGRAACEVNTCESIILTELVYEQVLQSLSVVDLSAVLSALVFTDRLDEGEVPGLEEMANEAPDVVQACRKMESVMRGIGAVIGELGVDGCSPAEYLRQHSKFGFVKGVRDWAVGKSFAHVCQVYDGCVAEGTIVRTIVRLCELLRELKNVGRVIGDPALQSKAQEACDLCRRDVIFAASLYVS